MKVLNADKLHDELNQISKRADFGEMALIPIRDFRILMGRTEIPSGDMVSPSEDYTSGYDQAVKDIIEYVTQLKDYYKKGIMCSLSESVQGESTCGEILNHLEKMTKR